MINDLVNHVKARLGASHHKLELDDQAIVKLLQNETLKTLSIYLPCFVEFKMKGSECRIPGTSGMYHIPIEHEDMELIGIEQVHQYNLNNYFLGNSFNILGGDVFAAMQSFSATRLMANAISAFVPPQTFQFMPPSSVRIFNNTSESDHLLLLRTTHKKDFSTFSFGLRETIKNLCLADVCIDLLGIRNYFQSVNTTFAEINLNIDFLQNQADKREEIIEQLRMNQLKNPGTKKIYIA